MYFVLKYIEYPVFKFQPDPESRSPSITHSSLSAVSKTDGLARTSRKRSTSTSKQSGTTTLTVENMSETSILIENKEVLVNPDCYLGSILDYICEVACLPKNKNFAMSTMDGAPVNLNDGILSTPGLEIFEPKSTYFIILKDYDESGTEVMTPLLSKNSEMYSTLLMKIRNQSSIRVKKEKSATVQSLSRFRSKESIREKNRLKSGQSSRKDLKNTSSNLPPIKQKN
ncbi:hypothetical protein HHI36_017512 [Cryptolaemus montrouzieri]|uniref:Uncharacterized protein n=1 Tax=Cryptolaemus montrouzieri TaxID=559131 RepID=A0ABD2NN45_9CUCU